MKIFIVTRHYDDNAVIDSAWYNEGDAREREIEIDNDFTSPEYDGWNYASVEEVEVK